MQEQPPGVDVQAQQVGEAVAGGLKDRHLDAEHAKGGQEHGPPGEADLAHDHRAGDQIGGQGDHTQGPEHQDQQEGAQAELGGALGERAVAVEHVGSTAVPGLIAKPILDLAVGLVPTTDPDQGIPAIERLGYQFRGDKGDTVDSCWSRRTGQPTGLPMFMSSPTRQGEVAPVPGFPGSAADRSGCPRVLRRGETSAWRAVRQ
jgi:hypothetical protein